MVKVNINPSPLYKAATQAFKDTCFLLGREFTQVISEPGAFEGFEGDIVDTDQLRSSQQLIFLSDTEAEFSWNTEYALYVHEGYSRRNGTEVKGRPWTTEGLRRFDSEAVYAKLLGRKLQ